MNIVDDIFSNVNRVLVYALLVVWTLAVVYVSTRMGYIMGVIFAFIPFGITYLIINIQYPYISYVVLFIFNYFVMGLSRYIRFIPPGVAMDLVIVFTIAVFILNSFSSDSEIKLKNAFNGITLLAFIWFLYCLFQILNPSSSSIIAWATGVRNLGIYFFIIVVLTSVLLRRYKYLKNFLFIWSILSLLAVAKALIQKFIGFDAAELRWLYFEGGSVTHVLYYGVRYFSFFTDAANFGTGIAFSGVVFSISAFYFKNLRFKVYYLVVSLICAYGMIISGTRGSIAVPFVAFTMFVVMSKNFKMIVLTTMGLVVAFVFLKYTYYGHGNTYIRRMRSIFSKDDPSLMIRVENQRFLRTYMRTYPFGVGIAMSRPGAATYKPHPVISTIPSDSWYVRVWMEVGMVGLVLHLFILLYVLAHGTYLVLFKLKNEQLKGITSSLICGLGGVYVAAYSLEIIGQFPTSFIMYMSMTFIFLSPHYDKELENGEAS